MPKIAVQGRTFHFEESAPQGVPLVFLSGIGGDNRAFSRPLRHFGTRCRGHGSKSGNTRPSKARFTKTPVSSMLVLELTTRHHHQGDRHGRPSYFLVLVDAI